MRSGADCNRLLLRWFPPYPSAFLSAMKAEYTPLPPTPYPLPPPPHHPIVGQQSQIPWMKQLQWAFLYISLQTQQSGFHASTVFNTTRPHLRTRSFPFPVVASTLAPSFRACLHGVGDPGLVGLVSFVFTLWGTQNKRNLPH